MLRNTPGTHHPLKSLCLKLSRQEVGGRRMGGWQEDSMWLEHLGSNPELSLQLALSIMEPHSLSFWRDGGMEKAPTLELARPGTDSGLCPWIYSAKLVEHPQWATPVLEAEPQLFSRAFSLVRDTGHEQSNNIMECNGVWYGVPCKHIR